jgi:hypothetical protein
MAEVTLKSLHAYLRLLENASELKRKMHELVVPKSIPMNFAINRNSDRCFELATAFGFASERAPGLGWRGRWRARVECHCQGLRMGFPAGARRLSSC